MYPNQQQGGSYPYQYGQPNNLQQFYPPSQPQQAQPQAQLVPAPNALGQPLPILTPQQHIQLLQQKQYIDQLLLLNQQQQELQMLQNLTGAANTLYPPVVYPQQAQMFQQGPPQMEQPTPHGRIVEVPQDPGQVCPPTSGHASSSRTQGEQWAAYQAQVGGRQNVGPQQNLPGVSNKGFSNGNPSHHPQISIPPPAGLGARPSSLSVSPAIDQGRTAPSPVQANSSLHGALGPSLVAGTSRASGASTQRLVPLQPHPAPTVNVEKQNDPQVRVAGPSSQQVQQNVMNRVAQAPNAQLPHVPVVLSSTSPLEDVVMAQARSQLPLGQAFIFALTHDELIGEYHKLQHTFQADPAVQLEVRRFFTNIGKANPDPQGRYHFQIINNGQNGHGGSLILGGPVAGGAPTPSLPFGTPPVAPAPAKTPTPVPAPVTVALSAMDQSQTSISAPPPPSLQPRPQSTSQTTLPPPGQDSALGMRKPSPVVFPSTEKAGSTLTAQPPKPSGSTPASTLPAAPQPSAPTTVTPKAAPRAPARPKVSPEKAARDILRAFGPPKAKRKRLEEERSAGEREAVRPRTETPNASSAEPTSVPGPRPETAGPAVPALAPAPVVTSPVNVPPTLQVPSNPPPVVTPAPAALLVVTPTPAAPPVATIVIARSVSPVVDSPPAASASTTVEAPAGVATPDAGPLVEEQERNTPPTFTDTTVTALPIQARRPAGIPLMTITTASPMATRKPLFLPESPETPSQPPFRATFGHSRSISASSDSLAGHLDGLDVHDGAASTTATSVGTASSSQANTASRVGMSLQPKGRFPSGLQVYVEIPRRPDLILAARRAKAARLAAAARAEELKEPDLDPLYEIQYRQHLFPCGWAGCEGELDGWRRLKSHVERRHVPTNGTVLPCCRWKNCKEKPFSSLAELQAHVRSAHLDSEYICPYKGCFISGTQATIEQHVSMGHRRKATALRPIGLPESVESQVFDPLKIPTSPVPTFAKYESWVKPSRISRLRHARIGPEVLSNILWYPLRRSGSGGLPALRRTLNGDALPEVRGEEFSFLYDPEDRYADDLPDLKALADVMKTVEPTPTPPPPNPVAAGGTTSTAARLPNPHAPRPPRLPTNASDDIIVVDDSDD